MASALVRKRIRQLLRCEEEEVETARDADETCFGEVADTRETLGNARDCHAYEELNFEIDTDTDDIAEVEAEFAAELEAEDRDRAEVHLEEYHEAEVYPPEEYNEAEAYPEECNEAEAYPEEYNEAEAYPEECNEAEAYPEECNEAEAYPEECNEAEAYPDEYNEAEAYPEECNEAEAYPEEYNEAEAYPEDCNEAEAYPEAEEEANFEAEVDTEEQNGQFEAAVRKWKPSRPARGSDCKRALLSQLVSVLRQVAEQNRDLPDCVNLRSTQATHRINHARLCHAGCEPLICKETLCGAAEALAVQLAQTEAAHGLTAELLADLGSCSALLINKPPDEAADMPPQLLLDYGDQDEGSVVGLVISRLQFTEFDTLPEDSVNLWYLIESPALLAGCVNEEDRLQLRHHAQLLDCASKRMGWAAAPVVAGQPSGVAYVVAVFDNAVADSPDPLASLPRRVQSAIFH